MRLRPYDKRPARFRGWDVVAGCFFMAMVAWGLGFYGNGLYLAYLVGERGLPLDAVSAGITAYYAGGAMLIMAGGGYIDRLGPRRSVALGTISLTFAVFSIARADALWQFYAAMGLMAIAWTTMSSSAINAIIAPWFDRRRGTALSLALTGASFGGIAVIPLVTAATRALGYREGLTLAALALGVIMLAVSARCFVRSPGDVGQGVDGDPPSAPAPEAAARSGDVAQPAWPLRRILASREFLTTAGPFSVGLTIQVGVLTHQISMLQGPLGSDGAAWAVSLTTAAAVLGRLVAGAAMDRFSRRAIAALNFVVQAGGLLLLAAGTSRAGLYAGCLLAGLAVGNMITFAGLLIHREFPSSQFNRVNRLAVGVGQILYATGPLAMSVAKQAAGGYGAPLYACAALACAASVVVWWGRPHRGRR
ncbi:MAG: MFS transporter [Burkholderiaceae bacterium]